MIDNKVIEQGKKKTCNVKWFESKLNWKANKVKMTKNVKYFEM